MIFGRLRWEIFFLLKIKDTFQDNKTHKQREMTEVTKLSLLEVVRLTGYITKTQ